MNFDPRITPARPDLAASYLEGKVTAARFVAGEVQEVVNPVAPMRREPRPDSVLDTEALKGERVTVFETTDEGWCWCQLEGDRYVGWMPANALDAPGPAPTHRVRAVRMPVLVGPSIKVATYEMLPFGSKIAIARNEGSFAVTAAGFYVPQIHLAPVDTVDSDFVAIAERFINVPYLWGGKTSLGLDCSALVQISLIACGMACPRDSYMQEGTLGIAIDAGADLSGLKRGDLVFWNGHVAIAYDEEHFLHANAHHVAVAIEPVRETIARFMKSDSPVTQIRRLAR